MKKLILISIVLILSTAARTYSEEECLKKAWAKFEARQYDSAMFFASQCIEQFTSQALEQQASYLGKCPPTGAVSDVEKNRIFQKGLLNDVSAAVWIKGRSAEKKYQQDKIKNKDYLTIAKESYSLCQQLSCGRCWDPKGWFWSPADDCARLLKTAGSNP